MTTSINPHIKALLLRYNLPDALADMVIKAVGNQANKDQWDATIKGHTVAFNPRVPTPEEVDAAERIATASPYSHDKPDILERLEVKQIFLNHGFTIKDSETNDLKPYVYQAAQALVDKVNERHAALFAEHSKQV